MIARALAVLFVLAACGPAERGAAQAPMTCERNPKCDKKKGQTQDCSTQCNDDPACMERCEEVQAPTKLGH